MANRRIPKSEDSLSNLPSTASSNQSGSNDFVKKLFQMLQEDTYKDVVRWTSSGDSFVVINTTEFTKEILPRHFKHSNFASFVRQLNKYDFHKVKIPNEEKQNYEYGEDAWEFKHPDFRINDRESLENIKRKSSKKSSQNYNPNGASSGSNIDSYGYQSLKDEMDNLRLENKSLQQDINVLQTKYKTLVENIVSLKNFDEKYYRSMSVLINCLVQAGIKMPPLDFPNPNVLQSQKPNVVGRSHSHTHSNSGSIPQLSPPLLSPNGGTGQGVLGAPLATGLPTQRFDPNTMSQAHTLLHQPLQTIHTQTNTQQPTKQTPPTNDNINSKPQSPHLLGESTSGSPLVGSLGLDAASTTAPVNSRTSSISTTRAPQSVNGAVTSTDQPQVTTTNLTNPKFHVLLVEDDNVCIQLCRKFLVKYGCQVTIATDGLNAISTVEHTKYDLVLMDIVMPNLDGATATSVIRSFDTKTPIIAMTGNIEDNDLVTYLQNGMSDILAKPFTKDDLYSILSKHLLTNTESTSGSTSEPSETMSSLQGPAQQTLVLPQEVQQQDNNGEAMPEPLGKKPRLI
ncbi:uncharacterized protein AC631_00320 [Debaryomyces fabryi]|uniref:Transcription factor n=1 Tax=Debaryomyces fabryi TaxID=58627 RepID=A0A0V1Q5Y5_9ASCO|nr:uncharacterized protein AC631_00320 [Debaryomyces fabryi]KSA03865.1 hypothetical protein AC631_00320 [Debaryomyces fabryi]CUM48695.1 unnamed protein product [Debaryomyces fabryi]